MAGKIPSEAFDFYFSLGPGRSYQAVADRYHVTKKSVTNRAIREDWQGRAEEIERQARAKTAEKTAESLSDIQTRHGKFIRAIQAKAVEALRAMPLDSAMDGIRALDIAVRLERGHTPTEADTPGLPEKGKRQSIIDKFQRESPMWIGEPLGRVAHWGDEARADEKSITALIVELCKWLDQFVAEYDVNPVLPFHLIVLLGFVNEKNDATSGRMRSLIYQLEGEYEDLRKERRIEGNDDWRWRTLWIRRPSERFNARDTLTWQECFSSDCFDPISFIARWLRQRYGGEK